MKEGCLEISKKSWHVFRNRLKMDRVKNEVQTQENKAMKIQDIVSKFLFYFGIAIINNCVI